MGILNRCQDCLTKQIEIDRLKDEMKSLKAKMSRLEKQTKEGYFGESTPSSKKPFKENSKDKKNGGAKLGHVGHGRSSISEEEADEVILLEHNYDVCPDCGGVLEERKPSDRSVIEGEIPKTKKTLYKCEHSWCPKCKKVVTAKPFVLPKSLYSNELLSAMSTMHYVHGVPLLRVLEIYGNNIGDGGMINAFHRIGSIFEPCVDIITNDYINNKVKHADETGWRQDGESGYAWLFCSDAETIFKFERTRSSSVPAEVFGTDKVDGVLVSDRYAGYNIVNCEKQYCLVHLLREVKKIHKEFGKESKEVENFASVVSPLLSEAIKLRNTHSNDEQKYYSEAEMLSIKIKIAMASGSQHQAIKYIQDIFLNQEAKLYQWVHDKDVPADNNRAERELRPTVVARKVSFGSQSEKGAKTRSIIMTVLHTARKRLKDMSVADWLKNTLDEISKNPGINVADLMPKKT